MKKISLGLLLSTSALAQLLATAAHAQNAPGPAPAATPAPAAAPEPAIPPPAYPPPPGYTLPPGSPPPAYGTYPGGPPPVSYSNVPGVAPGAGPVLRLFADNPRARIQQLSLSWRDVCTMPCGTTVDPTALYRVGGGTINPSEPFHLPRPNGDVVVKAATGSKVKKWVGFGLAMGGVAAAAAGGLFLAVGNQTTTDEFGTTTVSDVYKTEGYVYLISGAILMLIGFPMFASQSTSVEVH
ncbi:MAG TPA: hypothetical protein VGL59_06590 [Polyangia bacterium]|jgi:hypothetical protein